MKHCRAGGVVSSVGPGGGPCGRPVKAPGKSSRSTPAWYQVTPAC
ncbi:MAG TPA: hypothetical protein VK157_01480 [Phycisphaerales bacterium]|nr:hypothetical protein [Phycisphaerales bacterium]